MSINWGEKKKNKRKKKKKKDGWQKNPTHPKYKINRNIIKSNRRGKGENVQTR